MNPTDPNNPSNLDPKLKEAYDRIMSGTPTQNTPQQPAVGTPVSGFKTPEKQQQPAPRMQTEQVTQAPAPPPTYPTLPPLPQDDITQSPLSMGGATFVNPNPSATEVTEGDSPVKPKGKNSFLPVFIVIGILIFFVVYAVIWSKVFGLF